MKIERKNEGGRTGREIYRKRIRNRRGGGGEGRVRERAREKLGEDTWEGGKGKVEKEVE